MRWIVRSRYKSRRVGSLTGSPPWLHSITYRPTDRGCEPTASIVAQGPYFAELVIISCITSASGQRMGRSAHPAQEDQALGLPPMRASPERPERIQPPLIDGDLIMGARGAWIRHLRKS